MNHRMILCMHVTTYSTIQLADSEMLFKEGRHDFDLKEEAEFTDAPLCLCFSALIPCKL